MQVLSAHGAAPWWQRLGRPWQSQVRVNALVPRVDEAGRATLRQAVADGYTCVKIKVGLGPVAEEVQALRDWLRELDPQVRVRFDANRAWSLDEALAFASQLGGERVDYLEDPVRDPADLRAFCSRAAMPLALDESLDRLSEADAAALGAVAWVIKPTLRGGIGATLRLAEAARAAGVRPVISSAFESGVGLRILAQLAAVVQDADEAAGLDTGGWFEQDLLADPLRVEQGRVQVTTLRDPAPLRVQAT